MYQQVKTPAIVLSRTNFNDVDRIVILLTPKGQVHCLVKGARRIKSKLAAGVELFSVGRITYLDTRSELKRITGSELIEHYGDIAKNLERMLFGYECMKEMRRICPEETNDDTYYITLKKLFNNLNIVETPLNLIKTWWKLQTLKLNGEEVDLYKDIEQQDLSPNQTYSFSPETHQLQIDSSGPIGRDEIKMLRLISSADNLRSIAKLKGSNSIRLV